MHEVLRPWRVQGSHALCEVHVRTITGFVGRQEARESSRAFGKIGNGQNERVVIFIMGTPEDLVSMQLDADKRKVLHQRLANIRYRLDHEMINPGLIPQNERQIIRALHEITAVLDTLIKGMP